MMIENFIEIKSRRKNSERLKRKISIFIKTKNIFNLLFFLNENMSNSSQTKHSLQNLGLKKSNIITSLVQLVL